MGLERALYPPLNLDFDQHSAWRTSQARKQKRLGPARTILPAIKQERIFCEYQYIVTAFYGHFLFVFLFHHFAPGWMYLHLLKQL